MAQKEHQGWSGKDLSRVENSAGLCGAPTHQMLFSLVNLTPKEQRIIWKGTEVIQETQLETWNRSASGKRRDCDFELQGLGRKWCLHCNSQMLWRWRENKCLQFLHHLEEQVHKQNEALFHPIPGAAVELNAT